MIAEAFEFFRGMCHQDPARSPMAWGWQFPLCFRCSGIYGGLMTTIVVLWLWKGRTFNFYPGKGYLLAAALGIALMGLDGLSFAWHWRALTDAVGHVPWTDNLGRALFGAMAGVGLGMILTPALNALLFRNREQ